MEIALTTVNAGFTSEVPFEPPLQGPDERLRNHQHHVGLGVQNVTTLSQTLSGLIDQPAERIMDLQWSKPRLLTHHPSKLRQSSCRSRGSIHPRHYSLVIQANHGPLIRAHISGPDRSKTPKHKFGVDWFDTFIALKSADSEILVLCAPERFLLQESWTTWAKSTICLSLKISGSISGKVESRTVELVSLENVLSLGFTAIHTLSCKWNHLNVILFIYFCWCC